MALTKRVHEQLNKQIEREFYAHFLYRSIAMDLYDKGFEGIASWMEHHATEEYGHAERIISYLKENDARVRMPEVPRIKEEWSGVKEAVKEALDHEKALTADIHALYKLADEDDDLGTVSMLDWFVSEQIEEEHVVGRLLKRIELSGGEDFGLFVIDSQMRSNTDTEDDD